jgi:hypothetical protein
VLIEELTRLKKANQDLEQEKNDTERLLKAARRTRGGAKTQEAYAQTVVSADLFDRGSDPKAQVRVDLIDCRLLIDYRLLVDCRLLIDCSSAVWWSRWVVSE